MAHLRRVLGAARTVGVAPWACLLHGSAPGWFTDDQRGWLDDKAVLTWARHVDRVAEAVGDLVAGWVPIHEPALAARLGYGEGVDLQILFSIDGQEPRWRRWPVDRSRGPGDHP